MNTYNFHFSKLFDNKNKNSLVYKLRKRRILKLTIIIKKIYANKKSVNIIDFGGTEDYWNLIGINFLKKYKCKITLLNINKFEIKNPNYFLFERRDITKIINFKKKYDIAFSNSTIEHLYNLKNMTIFSKNLINSAEYYYCQTPNKSFFIEPHFLFPFFQYLNFSSQLFLIRNFNLGYIGKIRQTEKAIDILNSIKLLSYDDVKVLFKNSNIEFEKIFFLKKSIIASNF